MNESNFVLRSETVESLEESPNELELSVLDSLYERGFKDGYNFAQSQNKQ